MEEILPLLDDLGLAKRLKTERIEFCTKMFLHFDANQDGVLRCAASAMLPSLQARLTARRALPQLRGVQGFLQRCGGRRCRQDEAESESQQGPHVFEPRR